MKKNVRSLIAVCLAAMLTVGCGMGNSKASLSYDDAVEELSALSKSVHVTELPASIDLDAEEFTNDAALADIDTFDLTVEGTGDINIEIAAATELSSSAPDDWINVVAEQFNKSGQTIGGRSVSVTVRKIASGEVVTYMVNGGYRPEVFIPSNYAWGKMLDASGIRTVEIADRIVGNTAGILMSREMYEEYSEK